MLHLLFTLLLFIFLALIISLVLSLLTPESLSQHPDPYGSGSRSLTLGRLMKLTLKNFLLIVSTVFILGLIATFIGLIF